MHIIRYIRKKTLSLLLRFLVFVIYVPLGAFFVLWSAYSDSGWWAIWCLRVVGACFIIYGFGSLVSDKFSEYVSRFTLSGAWGVDDSLDEVDSTPKRNTRPE